MLRTSALAVLVVVTAISPRADAQQAPPGQPAPPARAPIPPPPPPSTTPPPPPQPAPPPSGSPYQYQQQTPWKMPHLSIYAGAAGANQIANGSGGAVLVGIQNYTDILVPVIQYYFGTELLGVRVGDVFLPVIDGDVGVRFTPFPDWVLRPYARANLGLSFLFVIPVPSAGFAVGLALPIANIIFFDAALGIRRAFNVFNANESLDLGLIELSVGF